MKFQSIVLGLAASTYSNNEVKCTTTTSNIPTDFVFIIDASAAMCPYSASLANGIPEFIEKLEGSKHNYRFAITTFGGTPRIVQDFTNDKTLTENALKNVGCSQYGQESGLEAIRMVLEDPRDMEKACPSGSSCSLLWRDNARKYLIMVTDEDSDRPTNPKYYTGHSASLCAVATLKNGYQCGLGNEVACATSGDRTCDFEPLFTPILSKPTYLPGLNGIKVNQPHRSSSDPLVLHQAYVNEVDVTAKAILDANAFVSVFMKGDYNRNPYQPSSSWNFYNPYYKSQFDKFFKGVSNPTAADIAKKLGPVDNTHTATLQYGDPFLNVFNESGLLNLDKTIANYNSKGNTKNLQSLVLAGGGYVSTYDIESIIYPDQSYKVDVVDAFYNITHKIVTTYTNTRNVGTDCVVGSWTNGTQCTFVNNGYYKTNSREVISPATGNGQACPVLIEYILCQPVQCELGPIKEGPCNIISGNKYYKEQTQDIITYPSNGGAACPETNTQVECEPDLDCQLGPFQAGPKCDEYKPQQVQGLINPNVQALPAPFENYYTKDTADSKSKRGKGKDCPSNIQYTPCDPKIDCVLSDWTIGECKSTDNINYFSYNYRTVQTQPSPAGKACDTNQTNTASCIPDLDCQLYDWSEYSVCSPVTSTQSRSRSVKREKSGKGKACEDSRTETRECIPDIDCVLEDWKIGECKPNGKGYYFTNDVREIKIKQSGNGKNCEKDDHSSRKRETECGSDCTLSEWTNGDCIYFEVVQNDVYHKKNWRHKKHRKVIKAAYGPGNCEDLETTEECTPDLPCLVSDWYNVTECTLKYDNTWTHTQNRDITREQIGNGAACPELTRTKECIPPSSDCEMSDWEDVSSCDFISSDNYNGYYRQQTRYSTKISTGIGAKCPTDVERFVACIPDWDCVLKAPVKGDTCFLHTDNKYYTNDTCEVAREKSGNGQECPQSWSLERCIPDWDCQIGEFKTGKNCKARDEEAIANKLNPNVPAISGPYSNFYTKDTAEITREKSGNGKDCPSTVRYTPCDPHIDCKLSEWSFGECKSDDEVNYYSFNYRTVEKQPSPAGQPCDTNQTYTAPCIPNLDCQLHEWSEWTVCAFDSIYDEYRQSRNRGVKRETSGYGKACDNDRTQSRKCIPDIDCKVSTVWKIGECKEKHGKYLTHDTLDIITPSSGNGAECPPKSELERDVECIPDWDCELGNWVEGECTYSNVTQDEDIYNAQNWNRIDTRKIKKALSGKGSCEPTDRYVQCKPDLNCLVGEWSDDSDCLPVNDFYMREQKRDVTRKRYNNGEDCPPLEQKVYCTPDWDCSVRDWTVGECVLGSNGSYYSVDKRTINREKSGLGADCPSDLERITYDCIPNRDCALNDWEDGECDVYSRTRNSHRTIKITQSGKGKSCDPEQTKTTTCTPNIDCELYPWSNGECTQDSYTKNWTRTDTRDIKVQPEGNGKACESQTRTVECVPDRDCKVGDWSGSCLPADTYGIKYTLRKTRSVTIDHSGNGKTCPHLEETLDCEPDIDCVVSESWTPVENSIQLYSDGKYYSTEIRTILKDKRGKGKSCGALSRLVPAEYKVDCGMSDWIIGKCLRYDDGEYYTFDHRTILSHPKGTGNRCGDQTRTVKCSPPAKKCKARHNNRKIKL